MSWSSKISRIPAPAPGQVLIRVEAASVNYADIVRRRNDPYPVPTPLPAILGGEVAGYIEAVGEGVTTFSVGDPKALAKDRRIRCSTASGGRLWFPGPRQQLVDPLDGMFSDAAENIGQVGLRIDAVHLCRFHNGVHAGGTLTASIRSTE
jgi:NADPH:quinone reductase-like Zn-dependent oxidoreductase